MIENLLFGFGFVAIIEGLVLALAPGRLDQLIVVLQSMTPDRRRSLGFIFVSLGGILIWIAKLVIA